MYIPLHAITGLFSLWGLTGNKVQHQQPMQLFTPDVNLSLWIGNQYQASVELMFDNINPEGTVPGVVVASTSRENPNYWYHWIRDSALVMDVIVDLYNATTDPTLTNYYEASLWDFVNLSADLQVVANPSDQWGYRIGEPKFEVDGTAFKDNWGRPQNDGPAIRARTLLRFARVYYAKTKDFERIQRDIFDPSNLNTVVLRDLEYTASHWNIQSFDLWEEVEAHNFYTRLAQREALAYASDFLNVFYDAPNSASYYEVAANMITKSLLNHWDDHKNHIDANIDRLDGRQDKVANLDIETVLASNHFRSANPDYSSSSSKILATAQRLIASMTHLYKVNSITHNEDGRRMAPGIGRYPEDVYDGYGTSVGNPWYLTTLAISELCFNAIVEFDTIELILIDNINYDFFANVLNVPVSVGDVIDADDDMFSSVMEALFELGDDYIRRVKFHAPLDYRLSEEFSHYDGYEKGARDLTWSYASVITCVRRRSVASKVLSKYLGSS